MKSNNYSQERTNLLNEELQQLSQLLALSMRNVLTGAVPCSQKIFRINKFEAMAFKKLVNYSCLGKAERCHPVKALAFKKLINYSCLGKAEWCPYEQNPEQQHWYSVQLEVYCQLIHPEEIFGNSSSHNLGSPCSRQKSFNYTTNANN